LINFININIVCSGGHNEFSSLRILKIRIETNKINHTFYLVA